MRAESGRQATDGVLWKLSGHYSDLEFSSRGERAATEGFWVGESCGTEYSR